MESKGHIGVIQFDVTYRGIVNDGVVILPADAKVPSGTEVIVSIVQSPVKPGATDSVWRKLHQAGSVASSSDLPSDLARNHDHYLHGQPKQS